ncbi:MAG: hypothetical protein ACOY3D_00730 [Candidatus Omnitrophota bacterium]
MDNKIIVWDKNLEAKFNLMISKIPMFHRQIASRVAKTAAEDYARQRNSPTVNEGDVVKAFLDEVPKPFYSMMIKLFDEVGFDYRKYQGKA